MPFLFNKQRGTFVKNEAGKMDLSEAEILEFGKIVPEEDKASFKLFHTYEDAVRERGEGARQEMQSEIEGARVKESPASQGGLSALFPYSARHAATTGEDPGFTDGLKDVGSLPGRFLVQTYAPSTGLGKTSEEYAAEDGGLDKEILTAPSTGWSAALAPVGAVAGGAAGGLPGARFAVPVGEALGMAALATLPTPILDDRATGSSVALEGLMNLFGGAAGAGLSKLTRKAATARMRSVLAQEGIGNVSDYTLDEVYDQLTRASFSPTGGSTTGAARKAMEASNGRIAGSLDLPAGNIRPKPRAASHSGHSADVLEASGTGKNKNVMAALTNTSQLFDPGQSPLAVRAAFREISENLSEMSKTMKLSDAQEQVYQARIRQALAMFNRLVSKSESTGGKFADDAFRRDMLDLLNSVGDIPGAGEKLAESVSGGYRNALMKAVTAMEPGLRGAPREAPVSPLAKAIKSSGAQGTLARLYQQGPVQLEHPFAALTKAAIPSAPGAAVIAGKMAGPAAVSFGADWLRKMYEQGGSL